MSECHCFQIIIFCSLTTWSTSIPLSKQPRLSVAEEWTNYNAFQPHGMGTYAFGYDVEDPETNNIQYRDEQRHPNGAVTGSYGYLRPDGTVHIAHYVADEKGYRVKIETNPRGQLKPYGGPEPFSPYASDSSPAMMSALRSKQVYKKQKVHEERTRPIDKMTMSSPSSSGTDSFDSLNEHHEFSSFSSDFDTSPGFEDSGESFFGKDGFEDPYRFFFSS